MNTFRETSSRRHGLDTGTRVALVRAVGTRRAGSLGTVVGTSAPGLGKFEVVVELDGGGRLFFMVEELRPLELALSSASGAR